MIINITVKDRIATYIEGEERPVCGNGSDVVRFETDEEWQGRADTVVRFLWGDSYHDESLREDRTCPVPVILNARALRIGLLAGETGSADTLASTTVTVPYQASVRCGAASPTAGDVEAYTNEAKDAAKAAQDAAMRASETADGVRNYMEDEVLMQGMRLGSVERHLNLATPFVEGTNANGVQGGILIPTGAHKYAKILKLWGTPSQVTFSDTETVDCIPNFPKYMWHGTKNIFEFPVSSNVKVDLYEPNIEAINALAEDYGMDEENYIYTEGDRWLYHRAVRYHAGYSDEYIYEEAMLLEDESEIKTYDFKGGYWARLKEPTVTDITDKMKGKSPYVTLSGEGNNALGVMNNVLEKTVVTADKTYWVGTGMAYATVAFEV